MATANATKEPSMEEILASIRQIIADEDAPVAEPAQEEKNDQSAVDDAFDAADTGEEMSTDDVDALFDAPGGDEEMSTDDVDALFDTPGGDEEMSTDDVDALFDAPEPEPEPEADEDDEVLALSADQAVEEDDELSFDVVEEPAPTPPPVAEVAPAPAPAPAPPPLVLTEPNPAGLLSPDAADAVQASFGALNSAMNVAAGHTLEDLVRAMLQPMLQDWLNENLPGIVDQKVQAEIERMTRK